MRTPLLVPTLALLTGLLLGSGGCGPGDPRPEADELRRRALDADVLVVLIDAAAAGHLPFYGYERNTTPRLAEVAAEGIVFERAYAQASATPLSVYSLMSSRYPHMPPREDRSELAAILDPSVPTLASRLAPRFPRRAAFLANQWISTELGFDSGFTDFFELFARVDPDSAATARADFVTGEVLDWWARSSGPRMTYVHYIEPHEPYTPPEPWFSRFDGEVRGHTDGTLASLGPWKHERPSREFRRNTIALYDGNLAYVDHQIGRLIDALREEGRWERTLFVLLSDHGEAFWEHGSRGHGDHVYEEYVRVPLLMRVPDTPELSGHRVETLVELVDLVPTLVDLLKVPAAASSMAGRSWLPLLSRDLPDTMGHADDTVFMRNHEGARVELGVRRDHFKFHEFFDRRPDELYDLEHDPAERSNLLAEGTPPPAGLSPARVATGLDRALRAWVEGGAGVAGATAPRAADLDSLDEQTRQRLKAIGYLD